MGQEGENIRTDYLTMEELDHICAALVPQNALIVRVMLHTGLRVGDVLALRTDQIKRQFWITEQKTGKRRRVGLPDNMIREVLTQAGPEWAFPGRKPGTHKTRQAVWQDIKRAAWAFRVPANAGTHSVRKTHAVEVYRKGGIEAAMKDLNHDRPEVTMLYAMADALRSRQKPPRRPRRQAGGEARRRA